MPWLADDGLEALDPDECLALLDTVPVGRVVVTIGALPAVFPVNFRRFDGDIVFLTGVGTKLDAALRGTVVAFEVDAFDEAAATGWSVVIVGTASEVVDRRDLDRVAALGLRPWARGERDRVVRVAAELCSGRRILSGATREDDPVVTAVRRG